MISRTSLGRTVRTAYQKHCNTRPTNQRNLAAAASGSFSYETGDAAGVKFGSRDIPGPTTQLAVVAKAGTRYQPLPGFSDGLEKFAFKARLSITIITFPLFAASNSTEADSMSIRSCRGHKSAPHFELPGKPSFWGGNSLPITPGKI